MKKIIALCLAALMLCSTLCSCQVTQTDPNKESFQKDGNKNNNNQQVGTHVVDEPVFQTETETEKDTEKETETELDTFTVVPIEDEYQLKQAMFSEKLFKEVLKQRSDDNSLLISPLSVMIALAMTQNGAENDTLADMEDLFGMTREELNEGLGSYIRSLRSDKVAKLHLADSIWFREGKMTLNQDFVEQNKGIYKAEIKSAPFDDSTVKEINDWVKENTDGMIDSIINEIDSATVMYLINALLFDAAWSSPYLEYQIHEDEFTAIDGTVQTVQMMKEQAHYGYINDGKAEGFVKNYYSDYAFVALLPKEGTSVYDYAAEMDLTEIMGLIAGNTSREIITEIPQFKYEYNIEMRAVLEAMGLDRCFLGQSADFSGMGESPDGPLAISRVLHKTAIDLSAHGTKAAAVTAVEMNTESCEPEPEEPISITLDRPFVYMIIDTKTNLPLFMGTVTEIGE